MKKILGLTFAVGMFLMFSRGVCAEGEVANEIKLYMGEAKVMPVKGLSRIAVGNPSIFDVTSATPNDITLMPKASGVSNLVLWDIFGETSYKVKVFAENISEAKRRIDNMLKKLNLSEVTTQAEEEEGKVVLLGRVKSAQDRERITVALGPLMSKTVDLVQVKEEESGVEIDVQLLELNKDATDSLGFTWPSGFNFIEVGSPGIAAAGTTWGKVFKLSEVQRGTASGTSPYTLTLDLLVQEGKARILSRPRLTCQSGKEAELLVGGEKPIFTTSVASNVGTSTEVEYKEYGIKLKIKPVVLDDDRIKLSLNVEVSEVGTAEIIGSATAPTAKAYPLTKRSASTELFVDDGQTMAIGGLIKQKNEETITKTPWLGDLPVLGAFFRKSVKKVGGGVGERGNTELFITLTPKIIKSLVSYSEKKETNTQSTQAASNPAPVDAPIPDAPVNIPAPKSPVDLYSGLIQKRILDNLTYPELAKQAGFKGVTRLRMKLSYKGKVLDASVISSSGYKILDDNALKTAKGIESYPPFPSSINDKEIVVDIPVDYRLD